MSRRRLMLVDNTEVKYLTLTAVYSGTFSFTVNSILYSFDDDGWSVLNPGESTPVVPAGKKIYFRANLTPTSTDGIGTFSSTAKFKASGNPMALLFGDNFEGQTSLSGYENAFARLFYGCTNLTDISELVLPATTLANGCYAQMFYGCTGLTIIPNGLLPAKTMKESCYSGMFQGCTGLTSIPSNLLPATTLANYCYYQIFKGCTRITAVPSLPATTMKESCYSGMFQGCTRITAVPSLPARTLATYCYSDMFNGCTGLTSIPSSLLPARTLATYCYVNMFRGCTGVTSIPSSLLPATTLASGCYGSMFFGCRFTTIPSGFLPATEMKSNCYASMFAYNANLSDVPNDLLPATELATSCYYSMFGSCSALLKAPDLMAETLQQSSYKQMFKDCARLNYILMTAKDISATDCMLNWVDNVAATGTFVKRATTQISTGDSGIPTGWVAEDYLGEHLNFTAVSDGTFTFSNAGLSFSTDRVNWTELPANTASPTITAGKKIYFRGMLYPTSTTDGIGTFSSTANFKASGNPMSLLLGDGFENSTSINLRGGAFSKLFYNCTKLTDISELVLPATTLATNCYQYMFQGCTGLTKIPSNLLPATTLASYCYRGMFYGCTGLTSIPDTLLPSTKMASYCYQYMFQGCTGLTSIPSNLLPATTLATRCYQYMFQNCTGLTKIPSNLLPATTLATYCYMQMFYKCTNLTEGPRLLAPTLTSYCYNSMFNGCSKLNRITMLATSVSATSALTNWVNGVAATGMFIKTNATEIPSGASGIPSGWSTTLDYFSLWCPEECTYTFSNGIAPSHSINGTSWLPPSSSITVPAETWVYFRDTLTPSSTYGIGTFNANKPFEARGNAMSLLFGSNFEGQTSLSGKDNALRGLFKNSNVAAIAGLRLPATTLSSNCYYEMFYGTFYLTDITGFKLPATTLATSCYAYMFSNSYGLRKLPGNLLPATTLTYQRVYEGMFQGCYNIESIPSGLLPATDLSGYCYYSMFKNCTNLAEVPSDLLPATVLKANCYQQMFYGCTSLTKAPDLPSTEELITYCYYQMFYGCSKLNYIKMLGSSPFKSGALGSWVSNVAASGTFIKNPATSISTGVSGIPSGWTVVPDLGDYLTFTAEEAGTFKFNKSGLSYTTDGVTWNTLSANTNTPTIAAGKQIAFKGNFTQTAAPDNGYFTSTGRFKASGNPMSLLFGDNFEGQTSLSGKTNGLQGLFASCYRLTDISGLKLPATTLVNECYAGMFYECTSLTDITGFKLPATTLATSCYNSMFNGCTGLTKIPSDLLPASNVNVNRCYYNMFQGCTGLTSVPNALLPATTVGNFCYERMFESCSHLRSAPDLLLQTVPMYLAPYMFTNCSKLSYIILTAASVDDEGLIGWVDGVSQTGTFVKDGASTIETGVDGIPSGWNVVKI